MEDQKRKHLPLFWYKHRWLRWLFPITGLLALIWFLVRVIPKPSRATYPCQRVAFPLASGFVVWLIGAVASVAAFYKAKKHFSRSRYVVGALCIAVSIGAIFFAMSGTYEKMALGSDPNPNEPIGTAKGINPGRVVWVQDANATNWAGPGAGDGYWYDNSATNTGVCESMVSTALQELTGQSGDFASWDAMFKHFNQNHGKGSVGYQAGEKIIIKLSMVIFHRGGNLDRNGNQNGGHDSCFNSPQMIMSLLGQLVEVAGVDPCDISIGSTLDGMPNHIFNSIQHDFPGVVCVDRDGENGRTAAVKSETDFIYWSDPSTSFSEGVATCFAESDYVINFAVLKGHPSAGITVCAKNHFGSFCRTPMNWWHEWPGGNAYLDLHDFLPDSSVGMGYYRSLVDLMGSQHYDAKGLLWIIDGLYGAPWHNAETMKWDMPPFNTDWPSSLFVSQDMVAIDSVAYDFLWTEFNDVDTDYGRPHMDGTEDYLHEAALAGDPCSGTFYDPDGNSVGLSSLGVHEHWNNATDKKYTRNLGSGDGIELVAVAHDLGYIDDVADSDTAVKGTVTGSYKDSQTSNDGYESIEEVASGGGPSSRYSYMEHKWTIDVAGGASVTFYVEAYQSPSSDGDNFVFAYSENDSDYYNMLTVTKTDDDNTAQSYELPSSISGLVYIQVKDTDQTGGNTALDTIYIDDMYIESVHGGGGGPTPGVTITESGGSTDVDEEGPTSDTYTVVLDSQPSDTVTITVDPDIETEVNSNGAGNPVQLPFLTTNWDTPQTVTVTAIDDIDVEGDHTSTITHSAASNDANYNGISIDNVVADVTDNDGVCNPTTIHVESIVCDTVSGSQGNKYGRATVTIYDNCGDPVLGSLVDGTFTGDFDETFYDEPTDGNGVAVFVTTTQTKKPSFTFCVDDVTHSTLTYDPNDNVETCDSN